MSDTFTPQSGTTNVNTSSAPWAAAQPYLQQAFPEVVSSYNQGAGRNRCRVPVYPRAGTRSRSTSQAPMAIGTAHVLR